MLQDTLQRLVASGLPMIVVNDGSDGSQSITIRNVCHKNGATLVERNQNGGKGAAVIDGLFEARTRGYSHAFQIDADGQHNIDRVPHFVSTAKKNPNALILGYPCYDSSVLLARRCGRWITTFWVCVNSLSFKIRDSMCGFRVYPVTYILEVADASACGKRMGFDTELCVRACWKGAKFINLPVEVIYPKDGLSNFRMWSDNVAISLMHARMFFGMILRSPLLLMQTVRQIFYRNGTK